jgi:hypothetical protein
MDPHGPRMETSWSPGIPGRLQLSMIRISSESRLLTERDTSSEDGTVLPALGHFWPTLYTTVNGLRIIL